MVRDVIFYKTDAGRCPIEEFLETLSTKQALKAAWVINLVEDMDTGTVLPEDGQYGRPLGDSS
ncbi:MAG: hypothetical protein ACI9OU_001790 [Candidatus Promineifilaceae bacterium]|jgi:hypothetical protein